MDVFSVGGVGEDEVVIFSAAEGLQGVGLVDGGVGEFGFVEVLADYFGGLVVLVDEEAGFGTSAEGFEAEGAGAGEEVEDGGVFEAGLDDGEEGFADAVRSGAGAFFGNEEGDASGFSGDDSHGAFWNGK